MYNQTYAYRLPPTIEPTARSLANWHEDKIFSDEKMDGIGNSASGPRTILSLLTFFLSVVAGRTLLRTILASLERIAFNGDPLQLMIVDTTYQPFISLFHMTNATTGNGLGKPIRGIRESLVAFCRRLVDNHRSRLCLCACH